MSLFKKRFQELDAWLANYRYHYNRRETMDEPSEEFFYKRKQWKMYRRLMKEPYDCRKQKRKKIS